ncbi:hypothetical protein CRG98_040540 [Punica granatum]|uniref:Uncharacterized protein n=1 Tax=Punica granatum TaxID=22663 RepID=A0A2I0I5G9_PUNGR|nr:hypothetical protein CRG98_040540 [Punica granatum]
MRILSEKDDTPTYVASLLIPNVQEMVRKNPLELPRGCIRTEEGDRIDVTRDEFDVHRDELDVTRDELDVTRDEFDVSRDEFDVSKDEFDVARDEFDVTRDELDVTKDEFDVTRDDFDVTRDEFDATFFLGTQMMQFACQVRFYLVHRSHSGLRISEPALPLHFSYPTPTTSLSTSCSTIVATQSPSSSLLLSNELLQLFL